MHCQNVSPMRSERSSMCRNHASAFRTRAKVFSDWKTIKWVERILVLGVFPR